MKFVLIPKYFLFVVINMREQNIYICIHNMNLIIKQLAECLWQPLKGERAFISSLMLLLLLGSGAEVLQAQDRKPSRQAAEASWNSGDFETAYDNYNGLLMMYTRDPLYAYYSGACLVNLERDMQRSVTLLRSALNSSQSVKTIPDEVWFYYGRALQMSGNKKDASVAYGKYIKVAGKKKAQTLNTQEYLEECSNGSGAEKSHAGKKITAENKGVSETKQRLFSSERENDSNRRKMADIERYKYMSDSLLAIAEGINKQIDRSPGEVQGLMRSRVAELEEQAGRYLTSADSIKMILGNDVTDNIPDNGSAPVLATSDNEETRVNEVLLTQPDVYAVDEKPEVTVSGEYDKQLTKAMTLQFTSDSLKREAAGLRSKAAEASPEDGRVLKDKASGLEAMALQRQREADGILLKLEPGMADKENIEEQFAASDSNEEETEQNKAEKESGTEVKVEEKVSSADQQAVFSSFELKSAPAYSASDPIPTNPVITKGLLYHIQLAAFRNPVSPSYFRNLYPVFGKLNSSNGVTYYYTGMFRTHEAAVSSLPVVKDNGFADAFVVAFIDNIQVSMEKAAQAEKYWSAVPLFYVDRQPEASARPEGAGPTASGTLIFRSEVLRSAKPVKSEVMDKIELLAGNKPLDIIKNNKGEMVILIGKFITFESADDYTSLLIRNGYSTAKVVAWVGSNEIPVETARELMKKVNDETPMY